MTDDPLCGLQAITFRSHVLTDRLGDLAGFVFDEWRREDILDVATAFLGDDSFDHPADVREIVRMLATDCRDAHADNRYVELLLANHLGGGVSLYCERAGTDYCAVELSLVRSSDLDLPAARAFQALCVRLSTALIRNFRVHSAQLVPVGPGLRCLPAPPLVESPTHLVVVTEEAIARYYGRPADFWNAGWTRAAKHNDQHLLVRELDMVAGPDYLARIIDRQWQMARAAKRGETGYTTPFVSADEEVIFRAGEPRLRLGGYLKETRLIEYEGLIATGQHVQGWEIFGLRAILESGKAHEVNRPVKAVRIVFPEQWMAESEKRPLLDIGCEVTWRGGDGALHRIEN